MQCQMFEGVGWGCGGFKRGDSVGWVRLKCSWEQSRMGYRGALRAAQLTPGTWNDLASD